VKWFLTALAERPRLRWAVIFLVVLAIMTVVAVVADDDDEQAADPTTTRPPATVPDEPVSDEDLAPVLLPAVGALGTEWIETIHDEEITEAEPTGEGECPPGPVPDGVLVRSEQHRTQGQELVEGLAVTAGILAEGVEPISLEDEFVAGCLLDDLQSQLGGEVTAVQAADVPIGPINPGAQVSHVRFTSEGPDGVGGTFDFVLVQRDRMVSLGLLTGTGAVEATPLDDLANALDAPLQRALPALS
jgi:hypothetical protein